jgi:hypothetical protein
MNTLLLLTILEQQREVENSRRKRKRVRRRRRSRVKNQVDMDQDKLIAELQDENEQLQLCVGALVEVLVSKKVIDSADIDHMLIRTKEGLEDSDSAEA